MTNKEEIEDFSKAVEEITRKKDEDGSGKREQELIKKPIEL